MRPFAQQAIDFLHDHLPESPYVQWPHMAEILLAVPQEDIPKVLAQLYSCGPDESIRFPGTDGKLTHHGVRNGSRSEFGAFSIQVLTKRLEVGV